MASNVGVPSCLSRPPARSAASMAFNTPNAAVANNIRVATFLTGWPGAHHLPLCSPPGVPSPTAFPAPHASPIVNPKTTLPLKRAVAAAAAIAAATVVVVAAGLIGLPTIRWPLHPPPEGVRHAKGG